MLKSKLNKWLAGTTAAGAVAFALSGALVLPGVSFAAEPVEAPAAGPVTLERRGDFRPDGGDAGLAEALGITEEELQTAKDAAAEAAVDKALELGLITETQAETLRERGQALPNFGRMFGMKSDEIDSEALLAEALGISVDELDAARETAVEARIAAAVEAGDLTQEEADLILARRALGDFLAPRLESAYEEGIAAAVTEGIITQEQADAVQEDGFGLRGLRLMDHMGGFGIRGGHGGGRMGHGDMFGGMFGGDEVMRGGHGFAFPGPVGEDTDD